MTVGAAHLIKLFSKLWMACTKRETELDICESFRLVLIYIRSVYSLVYIFSVYFYIDFQFAKFFCCSQGRILAGITAKSHLPNDYIDKHYAPYLSHQIRCRLSILNFIIHRRKLMRTLRLSQKQVIMYIFK